MIYHIVSTVPSFWQTSRSKKKMSLFDSFKDVATKLLGDWSAPGVKIDNWVFGLHYRWTVTMMVVFSVLLSMSQVKMLGTNQINLVMHLILEG